MTRDLFWSLRSRDSICCRGQHGQIHWHEVADLHMPSGAWVRRARPAFILFFVNAEKVTMVRAPFG